MKYGQLFLDNLSYIGEQLEMLLLESKCKVLEYPILALEPREYFIKASRGMTILDIVKREYESENKIEVIEK